MKNMKCPICNRNLKNADIKGTIFPWKDFSFVELLVGFNALSCQSCGEVIIEGADAAALDDALEQSIRMQTATFLQQIKITSSLSQKELARKMGITEVYFSELIGMKKTVSGQIFNYFKLLANNIKNLEELDYFRGKGVHEDNNTQISVYIDRYRYLDEITIRSIKNDPSARNFHGMLASNVLGTLH